MCYTIHRNDRSFPSYTDSDIFSLPSSKNSSLRRVGGISGGKKKKKRSANTVIKNIGQSRFAAQSYILRTASTISKQNKLFYTLSKRFRVSVASGCGRRVPSPAAAAKSGSLPPPLPLLPSPGCSSGLCHYV